MLITLHLMEECSPVQMDFIESNFRLFARLVFLEQPAM